MGFGRFGCGSRCRVSFRLRYVELAVAAVKQERGESSTLCDLSFSFLFIFRFCGKLMVLNRWI